MVNKTQCDSRATPGVPNSLQCAGLLGQLPRAALSKASGTLPGLQQLRLTGDHHNNAGRAADEPDGLTLPVSHPARLSPLTAPHAPATKPRCTPTLGLGVDLQEVVLWGDVGPEHLVLQRPAGGGEGGGLG